MYKRQVKQPVCQIQNFARCSQYGEPWQPSVSQSVTQPFCQIQNFHGAHSMVNRVSRQSVIQPVKQPVCQIQNFARCSQYGEPWQPSVSQPVNNHSARYRTLHGAHSMVNRVSRQSVIQPVTQPLCQIQNFARCSPYGEPCQPSFSNSASHTNILPDTELCTVLTVW